MFVLDTNILSAMMSTRVVPEVAAWIAEQSVDRAAKTQGQADQA
jgi:predicted nucleic acid-binding protein